MFRHGNMGQNCAHMKLVGGFNHLEKWWSSSMGLRFSDIWNGK
jgi:hypothetical protein